MAARTQSSFAHMCRAFPVRTGLFTLGPLAVAAAQLVNASVNGGSLPVVVAVAAVTCVFSLLVTRYHLAAFRRLRVSGEFD